MTELPYTSIGTPRIEPTGTQTHMMMHVDPETAVEVYVKDGEWFVNRFRNGEGWIEIHREDVL